LSISKRLRRAAVGVATIAVLGTVASTALAGGPLDPWSSQNDPNTTNVPYLAWRGENLRMVKCFGTNDFNVDLRAANPSITTDVIGNQDLPTLFGQIVQTNVQIEDWSGADTGINSPKEVINGARTFLYFNANTGDPVICFQDTWASQKAGLGIFKLTVSIGLNNIDNTGVGFGSQVLVMQHEWLAGWMSLNAPTLDEVSSINPATNPEGLGDPKGDGSFFAGDNWVQGSDGKWYYDSSSHPGQIRATVKGTLPLGQDFVESFPTGTATLPDDWATLANALATDGSAFNSDQAMRWDIHDEMVDEHGVSTVGYGGLLDPAHDAVDNVAATGSDINTNGDASFYRAGVTTSYDLTPLSLPFSDSPTAGPFDPNYASETLLPDGRLNAGDAPMPAARIDFAIAPNTNPLTSTDGVGSFTSLVDKAKVYSRDYTGSNATAHNLYTPFYSQWIPATSRDDFGYASGVDGALITNNFPGFLAFGNVQDWTSFPLSWASGTPTLCRRNGASMSDRVYRTTPNGVQTAAVYTDEHGEARIGYLPGGATGNDFYFDALNTTPGDSNNACDLDGVKVLGTSNISAIARYPYQKTTDPDKSAKTTLTKTVYNLFDKHLSYFPKNYNPNSSNATLDKLIVAHAQDINGKPFAGETACFSGQYDSSGASINGFFPALGDVTIVRADTTSFVVHNYGETFNPLGSGYKCTRLDSNGNAVFELQGSAALTADMMVNFTDEGIVKHIDVLPGASTIQDNEPLTPAVVLAGSSATTGAGTNGTGTPSPAEVASIVKAAIAGGFGIVATPAATPAAGSTTVTPVATITGKPVVKSIKTRLLTMRLVHPAHGKAYLLIKVQSASKTAKIHIALKNKHGKTVGTFTKTIKANKLVKIQSSLIKLNVLKGSLLSVK
jgi:hypothetical protein